jgi:hypothetical protein
MALTKTRGVTTNWTAVALNAVGESGEIDCSTHYKTKLHIQGFLDTGAATAHTGTEFIVQTSSLATTDEDWGDYTRFVELVGTCNPEPQTVTEDPAPVGTTTFTVASTTDYVVADVPLRWIAIDDPTLTNSELAQLVAISANASITILDGTTHTHAHDTTILGNIAFSRFIEIESLDLSRIRLLVNNNYDSNGAIINYKLSYTATTALS